MNKKTVLLFTFLSFPFSAAAFDIDLPFLCRGHHYLTFCKNALATTNICETRPDLAAALNEYLQERRIGPECYNIQSVKPTDLAEAKLRQSKDIWNLFEAEFNNRSTELKELFTNLETSILDFFKLKNLRPEHQTTIQSTFSTIFWLPETTDHEYGGCPTDAQIEAEKTRTIRIARFELVLMLGQIRLPKKSPRSLPCPPEATPAGTNSHTSSSASLQSFAGDSSTCSASTNFGTPGPQTPYPTTDPFDCSFDTPKHPGARGPQPLSWDDLKTAVNVQQFSSMVIKVFVQDLNHAIQTMKLGPGSPPWVFGQMEDSLRSMELVTDGPDLEV